MAQQTAVDFLSKWIIKNVVVHTGDLKKILEQAKQMEKEQMIEMYNAGYTDSQCNHINDAENYVNELLYVKSRE